MGSEHNAPAEGSPAGQLPSLRRLLAKHCVMALVLACVLFLVSGRAGWWRAWLFIGSTLGLQIVVCIVLHRTSPDLLVERSRMQKGTEPWDKVLAPAIAIFGPLAIWCTAAWDVRGHWPPVVPVWWSAAALAACVLGSLIVFWAMTANRFFAATVRIQAGRGQVVIDGGPYRYVRHPGYSGAIAFTLASPAALGSWIALVPASLVVALLVLRTALEDRTLCKKLDGYRDYTHRTAKRLVPGLW